MNMNMNNNYNEKYKNEDTMYCLLDSISFEILFVKISLFYDFFLFLFLF